jgi:hypothetical protein
MGAADIKKFADALASPGSSWGLPDYSAAIDILNGLSMTDIMIAMRDSDLQAIDRLMGQAFSRAQSLGQALGAAIDDTPVYEQEIMMDEWYRRMAFAYTVVRKKEIENYGVREDQANEGRVFLGCTPMTDAGVQHEIAAAIQRAEEALRTNASLSLFRDPKTGNYATSDARDWNTNDEIRMKVAPVGADPCCGAIRLAWLFLTDARQRPGASLNSNLAAAQHAVRARRHICTAELSVTQMNILTDEYDNQKRRDIASGKPNRMQGTSNPVFPPDFKMREWARRGANEGEADRKRCNADKSPPVWRSLNDLFPGQGMEGGVGTQKE